MGLSLPVEKGGRSGALDLTSENFGLSESGSFPRRGRSIGAPSLQILAAGRSTPRRGGNLHNKIQGQLSKDTSRQVRPAVFLFLCCLFLCCKTCFTAIITNVVKHSNNQEVHRIVSLFRSLIPLLRGTPCTSFRRLTDLAQSASQSGFHQTFKSQASLIWVLYMH